MKLVKGMLAAAMLLGAAPAAAVLGPVRPAEAAAAQATAVQANMSETLVAAIEKRASTVTLSYTGTKTALKNDLNRAIAAALASDDYLHYIVKSYATSAVISGTSAKITVKLTYWESLAQTKQVRQKVAQALDEILTAGMNDHQKAKTIHDWIVTNIAYDTTLVSHSAFDGLSKGRTVCQGYALLTYEMMRQAGIPVRIVEGSSRGQSHAWNLVRLGGQWYHMDTTWDDPVPDVKGRVVYNYYNVTDAQLRADHSWKAANYPKAVTAYDATLRALAKTDASRVAFYDRLYLDMGFAYMNEDYTVTTLQALKDKISAAIEQGETSVVLRYTRGATLASDMKKALAAQTGITRYSYTYESFARTTLNDKLVRLTLVY
ncbi:transglutaminase domain-containing protein [Paenibacillus methanolicus]|uniref:Transglutaminase superfamily protein n=1 Tax=Paenibacillus methanolicus TaxID=582686 RepID=A0A5S5C048_9BACL|nr:transglutaminase domain-containing protein [Paenibacillus methanolicus]TYP71323.1 transglutaminase superfamily protein [Paenibacillus methanolicus]